MLAAAVLAQLPTSTRAAPEYERDVRPILAAHCYACHGEERQRGALRLDLASPRLFETVRGREPVLVAGEPERSPLYLRVVAADPDERMPLEQLALSAPEIETLRRWIEAGAHWPRSADGAAAALSTHWAYRAPLPEQAPAVRDTGWPRQALDAFVLAELEARGLVPSPRAEAGEWLRRAALDLTGIPPTLEELDGFEAAAARDWDAATAAAADRLLASPRYGERMAQWWLDLARYADTNGYEKDAPRTIWPWRDWVIDAFASDMPFDRFTIEQLAGDLLPDATRAQRVATGFHRNTLTNEEGGTDDEEFRVAAVVDRANTTAQVWLGSTLACAQCHDHKFDPFSQREYYEFYAFFDQTEDGGKQLDPLLDLPDAAQERELQRWSAEREQARAALAAAQAALAARAAPFEPLSIERAYCESGAAVELGGSGGVRVASTPAPRDTYRIDCTLPAGVRALRLAARPLPELPLGGASLAENANFALTELRVERIDGAPLPLAGADADRAQSGANSRAANAIDALPATHWIVDGPAPAALVVALAEPAPGGAHRVVLSFRSDWPRHQLGSFALETSDDARITERIALAARVETAQRELDKLGTRIPRTPVLQKRAEPRTTRVLAKGSFLAPLDAVEPDVPAVLPPLPAGAPRDRLALARWLVTAEHPLTARVLANRLVERLFGRALVATLDDFGTRGDAPTNPRLLDRLALRLVELGWSLKAFQRELVLSAAYAQSSRVAPALLALDPDNALFARASRPRLEIETLRDQALALSGLLVERIGGPSVRPPQPAGVEQHVYSSERWVDSQGPDRHRRGLYTFWKRSSPYGTFATFDAPSRELACTRRARTNTPLQALALLNDPAFDACARAFGQRLGEQPGDDLARLADGFRLATARRPRADELARLGQLLEAERDDARELAEPAREPAAWGRVAAVLLNLDEAQCRN